jgi:hypothetical protein
MILSVEYFALIDRIARVSIRFCSLYHSHPLIYLKLEKPTLVRSLFYIKFRNALALQKAYPH